MNIEHDLKAFHDAITRGDLDAVRSLAIAEPALLLAQNEEGRAAVQVAVKARGTDRLGMVRALVELGARVEAADGKGRTALHDVATSRSLDVLAYLLENRTDVNAKGEHGVTPLHCASLWAQACVEMLLDHGAEADARDSKGDAPIHWALKVGNLEAARCLWSRGARHEIFAASGLGEMPFLHEHPEELRAGDQARDGHGNTPLHYAAWNGQVAAASLLLESGCGANTPNDQGMTPLHIAVFQHSGVDMLELLVDRGAMLDAADKRLRTPLHYAAIRNNTPTIAFLVKRGADANLTDSEGATPLYLLMKRYELRLDEDTDSLVDTLIRIEGFLKRDGIDACYLLSRGLRRKPIV